MGKSKTKYGIVLIALLSIFLALPAHAASWEVTFDTIPTRVLGGLTFSSGASDPAGNLSVNLPNTGLVATYNGSRMLELGMITGSLTGAAGDPESPNGAAAAAGLSGCVIEWICGGISYVFDSSAPSNWVGMANADLQQAVVKLTDLIKRGVETVPSMPPIVNPPPTPAAYLPSFVGLNSLTP